MNCETKEDIIMSRSNQQIIDDTNALAAKFYACWGYVVKEGFPFNLSIHGHEQIAWKQACIAQEELTGTDIEDVLTDMDE